MKFVVVGGSGYIGYHVAKGLHELEQTVVLLADIHRPDPDWGSCCGLAWRETSILEKDDLLKAFQGADCVVHCAAFGMSGRDRMNKSMIEKVNVTGTRNVIEACAAAGVKALVFTSSAVVAIGGVKIENGTEEMPYYPLHLQRDYYSLTKAIAEQLVLTADGKNGLRTCALRLSATVGHGEKSALPRMVHFCCKSPFAFGSPNSKMQFLLIHNAVQAHVKAVLGLLERPNHVGGEAFFINDGPPVNIYEFLRPIVEATGASDGPKIYLPLCILKMAAFVSRRVPGVPYIISRGEVMHMSRTWAFTTTKAERVLGYKAKKPYDLTDVIEEYKGQRERKCV